MTEAEIKETITRHADWIEDGMPDGDSRRAYLSCANLSDANLSDANLSRANLSDANLSRANLSGANLSGADLSCANLSDAYLSDANLSRANLGDANLSRVNLSRANLSRGDEFLSESEVRAYFTVRSLRECVGREVWSDLPTQPELDEMADAVIANRWHMTAAQQQEQT